MCFHLLCSYSCFQLVGNTQGCGLRVRLDRLRGRLLSLFLQRMWFFLCVPTCNFITWLLFHSGFYSTFYYRSLVGIGVSNRRAGSCHCSLPVINTYVGGQWKLVFSICEVCAWWWNLKRCLDHLLRSHLHEWFMHVLKKSLTPAQADSECWKELTGRLVLLSELGHSSLIIYNLCLQCIAQHEKCSETGNSLDIKVVLFCLTRSPCAESPSGTQELPLVRWASGQVSIVAVLPPDLHQPQE